MGKNNITDIIETKYGKITGTFDGDIAEYLGIPFAMPPVGELRFKRARECDSFEGVLHCDNYKKAPIQFAGGVFGKLTEIKTESSEDCLYLNIWGRAKVDSKKKLPVFIYIFGGGAHAGAASNKEFSLKAFARDGVIGVNFNYRLGPLGFYDFSEYGDEFESNCGLSDCIMALKWVHDNIEAFGGDPENVTICGESAGGVLIYSLLSSPFARPYFKKAIIMSGLPSNVTTSKAQSYYRKLFLKGLGVDKNNISRLKNLDVKLMLPVCQSFFEGKYEDYPGMLLPATVIDDIMPKHPMEAMSDGSVKGISLIIGTCKDEGRLFHFMKLGLKSVAGISKMLKINGYEDRIESINNFYHIDSDKVDEQAEASILCKVNTDRMFRADNLSCAINASKYTDVFLYQFDFVSVLCKLTKLGATHSMDVFPALETSRVKLALGDINKKKNNYIRRAMHGAFVNFAKTGQPQNECTGAWPVFTEDGFETMCFNENCGIKIELHRDVYELWKGIELYMDGEYEA